MKSFGNVIEIKTTSWRKCILSLGLTFPLLLSACSTKHDLNTAEPYIVITPDIANGLDLGQSMNLTATVLTDTSKAGVTWSYTGIGTLSNVTPTSATFTAPAYNPATPLQPYSQLANSPSTGINGLVYGISSPTNYITITSIAFPSLSVTYNFPINPPPIVATQSINVEGQTPLACDGNFYVQNPALYVSSVYEPATNLYTINPLTTTTTTISASGTTTTTTSTVQVATGIAPYYYSVASGALPPGMHLGPISGTSIGNAQISGIPTTPGTYNFTLSMSDSGFPSVSTTTPPFTVVVTQAPKLAVFSGPFIPNATTTLGSAQIGVSSTYNCVVVGDTVVGAGIPTGATVTAISSKVITLSAAATATATSTAPAAVTFTNPNLGTLQAAQPGVFYATNISTVGGGGAINWTVAPGSTLPPGLSLSSIATLSNGMANTGAPAGNNGGGFNPIITASISGTPTLAGTYTFSLMATDSEPGANQQTVTQAYTLTIAATTTLSVATTTLPAPQQGAPYAQTIKAAGGTSPYTWAVTSGTVPPGLTFFNTGILSGTPTTVGTSNFTVTVTDSSIQQQTATQAYTLVTSPSTLSIANPKLSSGAMGLPYYQQLVPAGGLAPTTWSVATGTLPPGLSLSSSGLLSGTPIAVGSSSFTIQVIDSSALTPQTAQSSFSVQINPPSTGANNAELNGSYAFLAKGFDAKGNPAALIGSFTANGNGIVTGGIEDYNSTSLSTAQSNQPLTGAYSIGSDNRGQVILTVGGVSSTFAIAVDAISGTTAAGGRLVSFNAATQQLSGAFYQQTGSAFTNASTKGGYTFDLTGVSGASVANAIIGEVQLDGAGNLSSGLADSNIAGFVSTSNTIPATTYNTASTGRGTETFSIGNTTVPLVYYVVSAGRLLVATTGAAGSVGVLSGDELQQTVSTFTNATLDGAAVLWQQSLTAKPLDAQLGLIDFDGNGAVTLYSTDEDAGGTVTSNALPAAGSTYTVASSGRVTINGSSAMPVSIYLVGQNQGVLLGAPSTVRYGALSLQTPQTFSSSSMIGSYALGTILPIASTVSQTSGIFEADGVSAITGAEDLNTGGVLAGDQTLGGTYVVSSTGRAPFNSSYALSTATTTPVFYVVSPSQLYYLDLSSSTPVIFLATHQ